MDYALLIFVLCTASITAIAQANFYNDFDMTWGGGDHCNIINNGSSLQFLLDKTSGGAFQSKKEYLFGKFDMQIKLVAGNSAGTVTAYYLSSGGPYHDEIDFEFLGNLSGNPYILHTNIYTQGQGNREQQFYLWFDPTKAFHTYSVLWSPQRVVYLVDGTPIRVFENNAKFSIPYPNKQAMRVYSSLWDAEDWATRGGLVKTDWTKAPFIAYFHNFKIQAYKCKPKLNTTACTIDSASKWWNQVTIPQFEQMRLKWVQRNYMIYNYCNDTKRFPQGLPPECSINN